MSIYLGMPTSVPDAVFRLGMAAISAAVIAPPMFKALDACSDLSGRDVKVQKVFAALSLTYISTGLCLYMPDTLLIDGAFMLGGIVLGKTLAPIVIGATTTLLEKYPSLREGKKFIENFLLYPYSQSS